jgi:hypothetical protein
MIAVEPIADLFRRRFILGIGNRITVAFGDLGVVGLYRKILGLYRLLRFH